MQILVPFLLFFWSTGRNFWSFLWAVHHTIQLNLWPKYFFVSLAGSEVKYHLFLYVIIFLLLSYSVSMTLCSVYNNISLPHLLPAEIFPFHYSQVYHPNFWKILLGGENSGFIISQYFIVIKGLKSVSAFVTDIFIIVFAHCTVFVEK